MHSDSDTLTARELYVIRKSFGVGAREYPEPPEDGLGDQPGPEELARIEAQALRKLRHMTLDSFRILREAV